MSTLVSCWPVRHWITHAQTHTNSCSLSSCYTICLDTGTRHTLFIHPAAWGCSPVPSALSRPGPSPSWSGCVSSAWLPWFAETPPWPRCRTPGLSASAPVCASPLWPTWEAAGNNVRVRLQIRFDGPVRSSNAAAQKSSPQQLLLACSVLIAQGFELCLSPLQLGQDLVLGVSPLSGSLLRVQQPLSHQLLLDASLQRACVRNTGEREKAAQRETEGGPFKTFKEQRFRVLLRICNKNLSIPKSCFSNFRADVYMHKQKKYSCPCKCNPFPSEKLLSVQCVKHWWKRQHREQINLNQKCCWCPW